VLTVRGGLQMTGNFVQNTHNKVEACFSPRTVLLASCSILWYQNSLQAKKIKHLCDFVTLLNVGFVLWMDTGEVIRFHD
jgi:hypothetical protein